MPRVKDAEKSDDWMNTKDLIPDDTREDFSIGQCYEDYAASTMICPCGNDTFLVGQGDRITVVLCTQCRNEVAIHDG